MQGEFVVLMEYERSTKSKWRFREVSDTPVIGTLYLDQGVFASRPDRIYVTVEVAE
jgi:hypothetical protein